ncbi:hypothetical protein OG21DRAFT_1527718 [Imleria badia]|nr:hypothetical protein OG21DRAFT_1527718 [Imleria badia]
MAMHQTCLVQVNAVSDIILRRVWNEIMDACWRHVWKRKHPWFDAWRSAESQGSMSERIVLSLSDILLLDQEIKKLRNLTMSEYLISITTNPLLPIERTFPLPIGLGSRYTESLKQGSELHIHTSMSHTINVLLDFVKRMVTKLEPDYFEYLRSLETSDEDDSDRDESKVQQLLGEDMTSETTGDDTNDYEEAEDDDNDDDTPLTSTPMPFPVMKANENFFQTFVANIFIF